MTWPAGSGSFEALGAAERSSPDAPLWAARVRHPDNLLNTDYTVGDAETFNTLYSAPAGSLIRGVSFAAVPEPGSVASSPWASPDCYWSGNRGVRRASEQV